MEVQIQLTDSGTEIAVHLNLFYFLQAQVRPPVALNSFHCPKGSTHIQNKTMDCLPAQIRITPHFQSMSKVEGSFHFPKKVKDPSPSLSSSSMNIFQDLIILQGLFLVNVHVQGLFIVYLVQKKSYHLNLYLNQRFTYKYLLFVFALLILAKKSLVFHYFFCAAVILFLAERQGG